MDGLEKALCSLSHRLRAVGERYSELEKQYGCKCNYLSKTYKELQFLYVDTGDLIEVHPDGTIKHMMFGEVVKPIKSSSSYLCVRIPKTDAPLFVHRLVADMWCEHPSGCNVVHHKDGDKTNNNYTNLEWTTQRENVLRSKRHG